MNFSELKAAVLSSVKQDVPSASNLLVDRLLTIDECNSVAGGDGGYCQNSGYTQTGGTYGQGSIGTYTQSGGTYTQSCTPNQ